MNTAQATHCGLCGSAIWKQTAPFLYRADTVPIQAVGEELTIRLWGRMTYQAFKSGTSFELVPRHRHHIDGNYETKIVLADHTCHRLIVTEHPTYWPTLKGTSSDLPDF